MEPEPEPQPEPEMQLETEPDPQPEPEMQPQPEREPLSEPQPEPEPEPQPLSKSEPEPEQAEHTQTPQPEDELPPGWEPRTSRTTGELHYVNLITEESTYDWPTASALPDGWTHAISTSSGWPYFISPTGESQYESPWEPRPVATEGGTRVAAVKSLGGGMLSKGRAKAEQAAWHAYIYNRNENDFQIALIFNTN